EEVAWIVGDAADLAFPVGRLDRVVEARPKHHGRADHQQQRDGNPELAAPDPSAPAAQDCFNHAIAAPPWARSIPRLYQVRSARSAITGRRRDRRDPGRAAASWGG